MEYEKQDKDSVVQHVGDVLNHQKSLDTVWEEFENSLGKAAQLWGMYIEMVLILKRYVNAERAGLWNQHLLEAKSMLPYTVSS